MNTAEFMRRYEATPEGFRAELINGVVHVNRWIEVGRDGKERIMPPISGGGHGGPQADMTFLLSMYSIYTPGVRASAPTTLVLSPTESVPEPDVLLRVLPESGGSCTLGTDDYLHGAPELIVEISKTSAGRDLGRKLEMYLRNGVPEYIVWRTRHRVIDWFHLNRRGEYVPLALDADGILKSRVFPGLWLDSVAMTGGDMARVLAVVQQGIASPEHAKFVEKLRKRAAKKKR
ncbi:Uma2 family endonuclease [Limnoglobus roseus]|nr:Uma2 family endonuclease [Limnoglobus roseus]